MLLTNLKSVHDRKRTESSKHQVRTDDGASTNVCYHHMIRIKEIALGVTKTNTDVSSWKD